MYATSCLLCQSLWTDGPENQRTSQDNLGLRQVFGTPLLGLFASVTHSSLVTVFLILMQSEVLMSDAEAGEMLERSRPDFVTS